VWDVNAKAKSEHGWKRITGESTRYCHHLSRAIKAKIGGGQLAEREKAEKSTHARSDFLLGKSPRGHF
jgi:hypothetical protein